MTNITLFAQIISQINRDLVNRCIFQYKGDKYNKGITSWTHLVSMLFCHFAKSQSLRDISNGLRSATGNLNHLGLQLSPSKSSLAYQNKHRPAEMFRSIYLSLLDDLSRKAHFKQTKFRIKSKIYLLDATMIVLALSLFDWARYKRAKGAIKLHTLLDYDGNLPSYICLTDGKTGDNKAAYQMPVPAGSVVVADRFYTDFTLWNNWDSTRIHFVIRHKENLAYDVKEKRPLQSDLHPEILKDEIIYLTGPKSKKLYPKPLRRVVVDVPEKQTTIELITNNLSWTAHTISQLYKSRWQIEIFFKEIKQLLKIKSFVGTSRNAVEIQIWTAMITILLLKYLKHQAKYQWHLSNLVGFIRLNLFVKISLQLWLDNPFLNKKSQIKLEQLELFDRGDCSEKSQS